METTRVPIKGMHCRSCEMMIEDELLKIPGVKKAKVNHKKGIASIFHKNELKNEDIEKAIRDAGYQVGIENQKPLISKNINDYKDLGLAFLFLIVIYFVIRELGLFNLTIKSSTNSYSSLLVVLLVGVTAGFSTCMALIGGLVLGIASRFSETHPSATPQQKFKPHLIFNLGRVISFFILGGIIGYAGSLFQFSPVSLGILTLLVGVTMFIVGLQLTDIFPRFSKFKLTLPKNIAQLLGIQNHSKKEYSPGNAFVLGGMTFFLPCGFTQAMQLYAVSSGKFAIGALTMAVFALGTTPGLLGIGGLTSIIKGTFAKKFFKFAGLIVIFLAIFNIKNGYSLIGWDFFQSSSLNKKTSETTDPNVTLKDGVQIVQMTQTSSGYQPNTFTIKKDIPVRWVINSENPYSCASSIMSSKLGIRKNLEAGENIIEFTPQETGQIRFSCSMGMYNGTFYVE